MSFTLTLPEDNALILNAMSRALAEIAQGVPSHGTAPVGEMIHTKNEPVQYEPSSVEVRDDGVILINEPFTPTGLKMTVAGVECVPAEYEPEGDTLLPDLNKNGLPWDKRINSTPASLTGANEWKMRRKPKDMDDDQWAEYIETVRNELTNLMSIEVDDDATDTDSIEPVTGDSPDVDSVEVIEPVAPPVTPEAVFSIVEPVAPPVTPEVVEPVAPPPAITTFPQLMTWLTGMTGKVTVEQVNGALAEWNMNSVALLAKRPDLIPAFITKIEELLK